MRRAPIALAAAAVLLTAALAGIAVAVSGDATAGPAAGAVVTAPVTRGTLSSTVSLDGTLTYRARSDGSPYSVVNQARGIYTALPTTGDQVGCGHVLYRVDDRPVLLLCGAVPAYRDLSVGASGPDVRQLNATLRGLGHDAPDGDGFTAATRDALAELQRDQGATASGTLGLDDAVFVPDAVRISQVVARLGGAAQPNADVLRATSDTLVVQVDLEPWQQDQIHEGDAARITLPGNRSATGKVERLGTVAQLPADGDGKPGAATIPAFIALDDPAAADGLIEAPVSVDVTTTGVEDVLSVPVTALLGKTGGGYAVEIVRDAGGRDLVPVDLGLFDTTGGRVEVSGDVHEGDAVVVPSS